ncbi:MAG: hypothetical protein J6J23_00180, partial [Clostridia bacterium]|nr:hypothetical protein [Clostridia bacterium]
MEVGDCMGAKYRTKINKLPTIEKTLKSIGSKTVKVGALKGDNAWLAGIHEYGCNIKAKESQYLTVPICSEAVGKKAKEFDDLFCIKTKKGNLLLVKKDGNSVIPYYWLTKSVKIPERSFLRTGHDENIDRILKQTERAIGQVLAGKMSIDRLLDIYGQQMATAIKNKMSSMSNPPNSSITLEQKG